MPFSRIIFIGSIAILTFVGVWAWMKKKEPLQTEQPPATQARFEEKNEVTKIEPVEHVEALFRTDELKLPIVETIVYKSAVPWLKGRPAWVADYSAYYSTSRHFIARSLNGKPDYFTQKVSEGRRFNVFRKDKNFQFYLLVDLSQANMAFYYIDLDTNERVLLKKYKVGLGKKEGPSSLSLTPVGKFVLGDKISVYRPGMMGLFQGTQVEMIRIFGTRWIPFEKKGEVHQGFGIHGAPWSFNPELEKWVESRDLIGAYKSSGCIQLPVEAMEELFSIVITKPTALEIVNHLNEASLPGVEVTSPRRS